MYLYFLSIALFVHVSCSCLSFGALVFFLWLCIKYNIFYNSIAVLKHSLHVIVCVQINGFLSKFNKLHQEPQKSVL